MMHTIAVIPARGGSKRIKHKNIRSFYGKPLIAYSIENALKSELFDQVIVSTDCEQIAGIAKEYGASVPFIRPKKLSDDFTGTTPVVQHAIRWYQESVAPLQYCCCLYPTSPLLNWKELVAAFNELKNNKSKHYIFSVTNFAFPIQRALIKTASGVEPMFPKWIGCRSQDLIETMHDAGQFYWGKAESYLANLPLFSEHAIAWELPRYRVQDIDTEEDWHQAELMYQALMLRKEQSNAN